MDRIKNFFKAPSMSVLTQEQYPNYDEKWLGHTVLTASLLGLGGDVGVNWVLQNIKDPKKEYNNNDESGLSPLSAAIDGNQPLPIIKTLVDGGAKINFSSITSVIKRNREDVLKYFIEKDPEILVIEHDSLTPLLLTIYNSRDIMVKYLIDNNAIVRPSDLEEAQEMLVEWTDSLNAATQAADAAETAAAAWGAAWEDEAADDYEEAFDAQVDVSWRRAVATVTLDIQNKASKIVGYIQAELHGETGAKRMFERHADAVSCSRGLGRCGAGGRRKRGLKRTSVRRKKIYMKKTRRVRRSRRRRK